MPDVTPKIGLKKPLGNETVSRAAYNENLDLLDAKIPAAAGDVTDELIGERTVTDTMAPPTTSKGPLSVLLSGLAYMIKGITGKSSWRTPPAINLETAKTSIDAHVNNVTTPHGLLINPDGTLSPASGGLGVPFETFAQLLELMGALALAGGRMTGSISFDPGIGTVFTDPLGNRYTLRTGNGETDPAYWLRIDLANGQSSTAWQVRPSTGYKLEAPNGIQAPGIHSAITYGHPNGLIVDEHGRMRFKPDGATTNWWGLTAADDTSTLLRVFNDTFRVGGSIQSAYNGALYNVLNTGNVKRGNFLIPSQTYAANATVRYDFELPNAFPSGVLPDYYLIGTVANAARGKLQIGQDLFGRTNEGITVLVSNISDSVITVDVRITYLAFGA